MFSLSTKPLISVIVYNYNYGKYLKRCLQSVLNQTYENYEILFTDNASTDDSWSIALDFSNQYPEKFSIARHRVNIGSSANFRHWHSQLNGKYYIGLCSDDELEPDCLAKSVNLLEVHSECSFVMFGRSIIDDQDKKTNEPPFFSENCIMHPPGLSLVYMMTALNSTNSQIVYRTTKSPHNTIVPLYEEGQFRSFFRTRVQDFLISLENPVAYIKDPLVRHRVHQQNHARFAEENLMDVMGQYGLNFEFIEHVSSRTPEYLSRFRSQLIKATEKHARTALRYSTRSIIKKDTTAARRYINLAFCLDPNLIADPIIPELNRAIDSVNSGTFDLAVSKLENKKGLVSRTVSYTPPDPWQKIRL